MQQDSVELSFSGQFCTVIIKEEPARTFGLLIFHLVALYLLGGSHLHRLVENLEL